MRYNLMKVPYWQGSSAHQSPSSLSWRFSISRSSDRLRLRSGCCSAMLASYGGQKGCTAAGERAVQTRYRALPHCLGAAILPETSVQDGAAESDFPGSRCFEFPVRSSKCAVVAASRLSYLMYSLTTFPANPLLFLRTKNITNPGFFKRTK